MHNIKHNKKRSCSELWVLWTRLFWTQAQAVFAEQPNGYLYIWIYFSHFCIFGHNDFCIWLPTSTLARRSNGCVVSHQDQRPKVGSFQITWLSLLLAISSSSSSNPQAQATSSSSSDQLKKSTRDLEELVAHLASLTASSKGELFTSPFLAWKLQYGNLWSTLRASDF